MGPERYFILTYHLATRELHIEEFDRDHDAASSRYADLERTHRDASGIEVVLVGADSIETIQKTHSHYFARTPDHVDLFSRFLEPVTVYHHGSASRLPTTRGRRRR